jgi:capsular exopolysaccharide synthesis family protein
VENLQKQIDSLRRWKWLIVAFAVLAALVAVAIAVAGGTTRTATSTLVVGSASIQSQATSDPESDAILARGYVEILNRASQQRLLREKAQIPADVGISVAPVAESPFVEVSATASDPDTAIKAADGFALAFVDNTLESFDSIINARLEPLRKRYAVLSTDIAENQQRLEDNQSEIEAGNPPILSDEEKVQLQAQLDSYQAEAAGLADQLRVQAAVAGNPSLAGVYAKADGATESKPEILTNAIFGLVGGALFGCAVALLLGALELRIRSASDVRQRLDLPTLGSVTGGRGRVPDARRAEDFKALATSLSVIRPPATSIAVVSPSNGEGKTMVAENLARYRAAQGDRVILIEADMRTATNGDHRAAPDMGLADLLEGTSRPNLGQVLSETNYPGLYVIPAGDRPNDPYSLFSTDRIRDVIHQATAEADLVVIDTPSLLSAAESQLISSGVDGTVLVLDATSTQPGAAVEARDQLRRGGAKILGVIINRVSKSPAIYS